MFKRIKDYFIRRKLRKINHDTIAKQTITCPSGCDVLVLKDDKPFNCQAFSFQETDNRIEGSLITLCFTDTHELHIGETFVLKVTTSTEFSPPKEIFNHKVCITNRSLGVTMDDLVIEYHYTFVGCDKENK